MSNYFCSAEWHFKRFMNGDGRPTLALLLYPFALGIAKGGEFYCSGERLAEYFDCNPTTIYRAIQLLEDLNFFVYLRRMHDKRKVYRVLTHSEWAKCNPGKCTAKGESDCAPVH